MKDFSVRQFEERDIPLVDRYWRSQTPDDLARMYVDPTKVLSSTDLRARMMRNLQTSVEKKEADPLIWQIAGEAVGMTNLNSITRGVQADIHLHMFDLSFRRKGYGRRLFVMSAIEYLKRHQLQKIICQPASSNPGPNALMSSLGIPVAKTYVTHPSVICFEHEVNRYELNFPLLKRISESLS